MQSIVGPRPSTLDAESGLQALPPAQQEVLTKKLRIFLLFWRSIYPLLDEEELLSEQVTFTAEAWAGYPPHILFYERKTTQGELALILPYVHIDPQTGQLAYSTIEHGTLSELIDSVDGERLMTASPAAIDIVQSALGAITWIAMACGSEGMVVAAAAGVLEIILGLIWPRTSPVNLPKIVDEIIKQDLAEHQIIEDVTHILTHIRWLSVKKYEPLIRKA